MMMMMTLIAQLSAQELDSKKKREKNVNRKKEEVDRFVVIPVFFTTLMVYSSATMSREGESR